ncbi:UDP-3-O-(3-hydroxymyristoyl)glucosamine N-acyltransferase [Sulfurospirillum sp. 1307]|jgi:UDP-3-O-[3-hydroxymyristoyl] glucosamine N-acyltransferase
MKISELLNKIDLNYTGEDFDVVSFATIKDAKKDQISFFTDLKLLEDLKKTSAGAVILKEEHKDFLPDNVNAIVNENPYLIMAKLSKFFAKSAFDCSVEPSINENTQIDKSVVIGSSSVVEEGTRIMPGVVIGANVKIGKNVTIYPNVVIYDNCVIKDNCIIQAGAIIGSDGFGYAHTQIGEHVKIYHHGNVVLEEDVEIGANTTIDKAVFGSTVIGKNTKIDNLVQIGHNCELGEACIIVSQTGLSGSSTLGRNVIMGGQSATAGHLKIGDFAMIAARGGVSKSIEGGKTYGGFPLMLQKDWLKIQLRMIKFFSKKQKQN